MELKWLIDYDNISVCTTESTLLAVEDDISIGSFASRSSRVSFRDTPEVHNFEQDKISNCYVNELSPPMQMLTDIIDEAIVAQKSHYHLPADLLVDNYSIEDIT